MNRSDGARAGLYIHVPFCASICPYCDFAVMKGDGERRLRFAEALIDEIELSRDFDPAIDTVYLGGGTPSRLSDEQLAAILDAARSLLKVGSDVWLTLEANPEDVDGQSLDGWKRLGVDTLSLGVQSFDDRSLDFLGRVHGSGRSHQAVENALSVGFPTVSLDLIYGLPGQTLEGWRRDLDAAIACRPQHISCYQLTVHERTVFGVRKRRGQLVELASDQQEELFFETHERLAAAGYEGYEVSNFAAAPEYRSRHNRKYWRHTPYLGVGPSAHSFDGERRWWNERKEISWRRRILAGERPIAGDETLSAGDVIFERLMLGLRTTDGVDLGEVEGRFGVDIEGVNERLLDELTRSGLVARSGGRVVPTLAGMAVADSLALRFEIPAR